jgi:3-oxoisoapionate kinase
MRQVEKEGREGLKMNDLLMAYYGDDFTGSADAMEALTLNGVPTVLFLDKPDPALLKRRLKDVRAVGVAGTSRTMTPSQMDGELPGQFQMLKDLGVPIIHYKVCATFDSSAKIGSIGHAADIAFRVLNPPFGVIVQGVPVIGRYVVFGNHFTTVGNKTYRLDRHPMMSRHPITPMDEGDLRLHFAKQTQKKVELIDVLQLSKAFESIVSQFDRYIAEGNDIVLFDTLEEKHLRTIGRLIHQKTGPLPIYAIGSSGFEYAMARYWQSAGIVSKPDPISPAGPVDRLVVISGSAADKTAEQVKCAIDHGFAGIRLNTDLLIDPVASKDERNRVIRLSLEFLREGKSIILFSTLGPEDPCIRKTKDKMKSLGLDANEVGKHLGKQQGLILRELVEKAGLKRVCVAGGDTCSYVFRQMDIHSLELLMPITPAAPLCRAFSDNPTFEGLQVASKGGQIGAPEYFIQVLNGELANIQ